MILQNQLKDKLPAEFVAMFPHDIDIAFAAIPVIRALDESLRDAVQLAFAESMATIWKVMIGISGLGLLTVFALKEIPMSTTTDDNYGLESARNKDNGVEEGARSVG